MLIRYAVRNFAAVMLVLAGLSNVAVAQSGDVLVHVNRRGATIDRQRTGALGNPARFSVYLEADRSYECAGYANNTSNTGGDPEFNIDINNIVDGSSNTLLIGEQVTATGGRFPQVNAADGTVRNVGRVSLRPQTSDRYYIPFAVNIDGGGNWSNGGTGDLLAWVECYETTLYGSFNTFVNDFNFLELTNTSSSTVTGNIRILNSDATVIVSNQSFSVEAGRRFDFDIHTLAGSQKYGTVIVTHDGNLRTLLGNVSQYKGTAADFSLVASLPMTTR